MSVVTICIGLSLLIDSSAIHVHRGNHIYRGRKAAQTDQAVSSDSPSLECDLGDPFS